MGVADYPRGAPDPAAVSSPSESAAAPTWEEFRPTAEEFPAERLTLSQASTNSDIRSQAPSGQNRRVVRAASGLNSRNCASSAERVLTYGTVVAGEGPKIKSQEANFARLGVEREVV